MTEPIWVSVELVVDIHAEQLALFGGPAGIRDHGLLESALARAPNKYSYGDMSLLP
jgi:death-on-curing protein